MARDETQWDDDDCQYSSRDSDDSPLLYRHDRRQRDRSERKWPVTLIAKFSLFSTAMILFCVLMYIPVYNRANYQMPKVAVAGWSIHTNRDTKIYVQPNNITTLHEPRFICTKRKLFLLIVVCSSTTNFERRVAIRQTWANGSNYVESARIFHAVHEKYKNYNYTYDLEANYTDRQRRDIREDIDEDDSENNVQENKDVRLDETDRNQLEAVTTDEDEALENVKRTKELDTSDLNQKSVPTEFAMSLNRKKQITKRDLSFNQILPELAKALSVTVPTDDRMLPEFDMNKEIGEVDYDYEYDTNIMKIPPRGEESFNFDEIISKIRENYPKDVQLDYKVVFLLGLPAHDNSSEIQDKIDEEVDKYGDIIQEGFVDSYNNLTLKSIMMLKWVTNNCAESVRYILKTDDDMYINVPNLMMNLQNRSTIHDKISKEKEYLLIGDLICGARPVLDTTNKWYSPHYMYSGRFYPRYLSGTGYVLSLPTALALYEAALRTPYFHLEDIYITGMCALRAVPRITPRDEAGFSYTGGGGACAVHSKLTAHRVTPYRMRRVAKLLTDVGYVDRCERLRLTQVRKDRLKPKQPTKRQPKIALGFI